MLWKSIEHTHLAGNRSFRTPWSAVRLPWTPSSSHAPQSSHIRSYALVSPEPPTSVRPPRSPLHPSRTCQLLRQTLHPKPTSFREKPSSNCGFQWCDRREHGCWGRRPGRVEGHGAVGHHGRRCRRQGRWSRLCRFCGSLGCRCTCWICTRSARRIHRRLQNPSESR